MSENLYLIIHGATFPEQLATVIRPVLGGVRSETDDPRPGTAVCEYVTVDAKERYEANPGMFPRTHRLPVNLIAEVGTLEQLAESHKKRLEIAAGLVEESLDRLRLDRDKVNEHLARLRGGESEIAVLIPWDNQTLPALEEKRRAMVAGEVKVTE